MKLILCWLLGHNWFVCGGNGVRFQRGMETFNYKYCTRCGKTVKFDIRKAEKPLSPINLDQEIDWANWYADHEEAKNDVLGG